MARNIAPQDVSWFLDLHSRGRLDLNPPYQRKSVWTPRERRFFLDTVFNGYPSPPVFLHKSISDEGIATYHVVDGKQRLETIINFSDNKLALSEDIQDDRLKGRKWKGIDVDMRKVFWNYPVAVEMLDVVESATVREIFDRYNRTSKNLERQELRHARYDGWFKKVAEDEVREGEWKRLGIVTTATARRMKDVQFVSELMIVLMKRNVFGFNQDLLDQYYADYEIPTEADPTFSDEEFRRQFHKAKTWILALERAGGVVTEHARSATNFYSLWSLVALNFDHLPDPDQFSHIYRSFMNDVLRMVKSDSPEMFAGLAEQHPHAFLYAQNARGANTEFPQRLERHRALVRGILGIDVDANEDN